MNSSAEKKAKVKKIIKGLAQVKVLQKEAIRKKKARKYIKTAGKVIKTGLWVVPLVIGLIEPMIGEAQAEEVDGYSDELDISEESIILDEFSPEIIESVKEVFNDLESLGDTLSDDVFDAIADDIDPEDLEMNDIIAAESVVTEMCNQMQNVL